MKNMKFKIRYLLFALLFALLALPSCSSISQQESEKTAVNFINSNVKFFAKEQNSTLALPKYTIDSISSYRENSDWVVIMHVSASTINETKKNDLTVKVDNRGRVVEFNGKTVPE